MSQNSDSHPAPNPGPSVGLDRRTFLAAMSALGLGSTALPDALWAESRNGQEAITKAMVTAAAQLAGLDFTDEELDLMVEDLDGTHAAWSEMGLDVSDIIRGEIHDVFVLTDPDQLRVIVYNSHVVGAV